MMKIASVNATIAPNGTRFKYTLNDDSTLEKLQKNATTHDMCVDRTKNDNSVSIQMNTGAYLATVVPLIQFYLKNKGLEINSKQTNGLVVFIKEVAQQKDARGTIVSTLVDLEVDGEHVKVTTYDTTGLVRVQGKGQHKFAEQLLIPHLENNVSLNTREIKMTNEMILMHNNKPTKTKPTRAIRKNAIRKPKSDNDESNDDDHESDAKQV